jgi:hypothetical protein
MAAVIQSTSEPAVAIAKDREAGSWHRYLKVLDVGVLLASLLIFLVFLGLLVRFVFPEGQRLGDIVVNSAAMPLEAREIGQVDVSGGRVGGFGNFSAYLGDVRREVKIRPADSIAWRDASQGITVHSRDAVQTFSRSRARVDFTTNNELRIGQNSLVVFRSGSADPFLQTRDPAVVVMSGEVTGRVNADYGALGVQFPAGLVALQAGSQFDEAVDFRLGVNPDGSSTLAVYSGQADVTVGGQRYRVSSDQGVTITEDGRTTGARALPSLPEIRAPYDNATAKYLAMPPRVTFRWNRVSNAQNYRFEIARDPGFEEILVDEYLDDPAFTHGNLSSGDYFWRVSARDGWIQGPASTPRRLRVLRDSAPPPLELRPIQQAAAGDYILRGETTPDATIYVRGETVKTSPDGSFEFVFNPEPGTQTIVVESIDEVGNAAYSSQILHVPGTAVRSE